MLLQTNLNLKLLRLSPLNK
jgi:hypothetical protein